MVGTEKREMTASEMGRRGGTARAKNLTAKERSEGARKAANALWKKRRAQQEPEAKSA